MVRFIGAVYFLTLVFSQGVDAEELDFPTNGTDDYSVADLHRFACVRDDLIRLVYLEYVGSIGEPPCTVVYEKQPPWNHRGRSFGRPSTARAIANCAPGSSSRCFAAGNGNAASSVTFSAPMNESGA